MKVNCPNIYCYHHGVEYMCNCKITNRQNLSIRQNRQPLGKFVPYDDRVNYSNRCEKRRLYEQDESKIKNFLKRKPRSTDIK